ncbi:MAG: hypothetical protein GDA67_09275 [Nitrospira sp. CR1.3]|nr:hypothetical protein [Nitrospira sp. CR1.3]
MSWMFRMLPTCRDMARLLSDSMEGRLPIHVRMRMSLHLRMCVLCEGYKRHLALIRNVLRKDSARLIETDRPEEPRLSPEAKERIRRAVESSRK